MATKSPKSWVSLLRSTFMINISIDLLIIASSVWMIHCHTVHHMIMGMQTVWIMGNASQITRETSPNLVEGYLSFGGDAYGNASYSPLVNHQYEN